MNFKRDWDEFWYTSVSTGPVGLVRMALGFVIMIGGFQLWPDRFAWFSEHGVLTTLDSVNYGINYTAGPRFIELLNGATDKEITIFFVIYLVAAFLMTIGLWTRPALFLVWIGLHSIHTRNMVVNTTGGDQLMIIITAYLLFARSGGSFSVDRLLRVRAGKEGEIPAPMAIWPQRLMQLQIALVYLSTFLNKSGGDKWQHGTAAYYPYMVQEFHRFHVPLLDAHHMWFVEFSTYATLGVEIALGTLIWVPRLRLYVVLAGILLHLGIEYAMNIPLFAWVMISTYLCFLNEADLIHFRRWLKKRFKINVPNAVDLVGRKKTVEESAENRTPVEQGAGASGGS